VAIRAGAGGRGEGGDTEVQAEFVLTLNVPTTITPGDEALVTVGVFNDDRDRPIRVDAVRPGCRCRVWRAMLMSAREGAVPRRPT
jgi:hypothetical protein